MVKKILRFLCTKLATRQVASYGEEFRVNFPCRFTKNTSIGKCCNFNGINVYGGGSLRIGDYFHSGKRIEIYTDSHNYDKGEAIPYDSTDIYYKVDIGDFVWFGSDVKVLGNVSIAEGAIIQAGSVVVTDIPYCGIAGGNPAKVFKYRDIEHFEELKKKQKFN